MFIGRVVFFRLLKRKLIKNKIKVNEIHYHSHYFMGFAMIFTPTMTGIATPDPLKFAFTAKTSPHASRGGVRPITVDEVQWTQWWDTESSATTRALYIHIPFCRKRCSFCNFFENGANPARIEKYVNALCDELARAAKTPFIQSQAFTTVYVGGGTPTDMSAPDIAKLAEAIQLFPLIDNAEVTLEGRINGFSDDKWHAALDGGFNRFSFGAQSFNTEVRKQAGRFDDKEALIARLQQLSAHETATIVADLIFGLPGQTMEIWLDDVKSVMESNVHGVDLYQLINLPGSRIDDADKKGKMTEIADSQMRAEMYARGAHILESNGWERMSSCHWRRDKRESSVYNFTAKQDAEVVPFGAGAGGSIHGHGLMNGRDLKAWHQAQEDKVKVPGMIMSKKVGAEFDGIIKSGLDHGGLLLNMIPSDMCEHLMHLFAKWQEHQLAIVSGEKIALTLAGRFWNVNLQMGLFEYLVQNPLPLREAC